MAEKFVKTRDYRGTFRLFKRLRRSKSSREYLAYRAMQKIGVPCPGGLELNDERNAFGLLNVGELSMDMLENAVDLRFVCLLEEHKALITNPEFRRDLIAEVAKWVRVTNENNFYHQNLNFRNVLVRTEPPLPVQVTLLMPPAPRSTRRPMLAITAKKSSPSSTRTPVPGSVIKR